MSLPKLNERLITRVMQHIKKFPESYNQNTVADSCDKTKGTPCGAIGCFGGWAVMLGMPMRDRHDNAAHGVMLDDARDVVGLTEDEANYLFDSATGVPKSDYKIIQDRLKNIHNARKALKKVNLAGLTFDGVSFETSDGIELGYSDYL
jgi:hypothetical protein